MELAQEKGRAGHDFKFLSRSIELTSVMGCGVKNMVSGKFRPNLLEDLNILPENRINNSQTVA